TRAATHDGADALNEPFPELVRGLDVHVGGTGTGAGTGLSAGTSASPAAAARTAPAGADGRLQGDGTRGLARHAEVIDLVGPEERLIRRDVQGPVHELVAQIHLARDAV